MKKTLLAIFTLGILFTSCGGDSPEDLQANQPMVVQDSIPTLDGEFMFLGEEAVFKGDTFIYGVRIDSLSRDLAEQVKPYKTREFDMIPVVVKAKIIQAPRGKGWDKNIEIREVLEINAEKPVSSEESQN